MRIEVRPRGDGKTTDMLLRAHNSGILIVCFTQIEVDRLKSAAKELEVSILEPIRWSKFITDNYDSSGVKEIAIDNLDMCLMMSCKTPISLITMSSRD